MEGRAPQAPGRPQFAAQFYGVAELRPPSFFEAHMLAEIYGLTMQLTLKRSIIRPWRLDDAESLVRHADNRKVWIALRDIFPHPYTLEDAHSFLKSVTNSQ